MDSIENLLTQFQQKGYSETLIEQLIKSEDPRVVDLLINELSKTETLAYPSYEGEWRYLSPEEQKAYGQRRRDWTLNWYKRNKLATALGELRAPHALLALEQLLDDTEEVDMWGTGVSFSIAQVAQDAIQKIKGAMTGDDQPDDFT